MPIFRLETRRQRQKRIAEKISDTIVREALKNKDFDRNKDSVIKDYRRRMERTERHFPVE